MNNNRERKPGKTGNNVGEQAIADSVMTTENKDCPICIQEVTDIGILCDGCSLWFHPSCIGMSIDTYSFLSSSDNIWMCSRCRPTVKEKLDVKHAIDEMSDRFGVEMLLVKNSITDISQRVSANLAKMEEKIEFFFERFGND